MEDVMKNVFSSKICGRSMIPKKWSYDITRHLQLFQMQRNVTIMTYLGQLEKVLSIEKRY